MKKDILFPKVEGVSLAIAQETRSDVPENVWKVYLINKNTFPLFNVLIASKGYGHKDGEAQKTSILRHMFEKIEPNSVAEVEVIDPSVFHLANEYWLSYYTSEMSSKIYDKKFVFMPESIIEANLTFIPELQTKGVLHG
jgi:hypothetical protein